MENDGENQPENTKDLQTNQPANVLDLFTDALKSDGSIDMRSTWGRGLRAVKDALRQDQAAAIQQIIENDIAIYLTIQKAIECFVLSSPESIITKEGLNPLISKDLMRFKEATRRSLSLLMDLKRKGKGKKKGRDLEEIFID